MSEYDLLQFVNKTLQGNFSKYPLVASEVARRCCSESSFDKASQKFKNVNAAVARIFQSEATESDTEKVELKLNALVDFRKIWGESQK